MTHMKKTTDPLMQFMVLLMAALVMFLVVSLLSALLTAATGGGQSLAELYTLQVVMQVCALLLPSLWVARRYYRDEMRAFCRFNINGRSWLRALVGCVMLALLVPAVDALDAVNQRLTFPASLAGFEQSLRQAQEATQALTEQMVGAAGAGRLLVNLLVVALLPAVCEECFFRMGVQNLLQRRFGSGRAKGWGTHLAVWLTAIIFSLVHGEVFSFLPRLLLGALLGYLYAYGNSLVINVAVHFVNNAVVVVAHWLVASGYWDYDLTTFSAQPWYTYVAFGVAAVVLFDLFFIHPPRRWRAADEALEEVHKPLNE